MKMEPEPWILQEVFLGGCRAITKLVLLGVQSGVVLMAKVPAPSHCQWGCSRGGPGRCPEGCPSCVATKVWGAHGKKPGRVMLEPEGCWRSLPRSCLLSLQCLLSFVGCKEIKGATSSLHEIISLLSLSRHPQWLLLSVIPLGSCSTIQRWCSSAKRCHPWCQWISLTICHRLSLC